MRFVLTAFVSLLMLTIDSSLAHAQSVTARAAVDSVEAGDVFNYSITLSKDRTYDRVIYPDSASFTDNFELRDLKHYSVADFKDSLSYTIQFWGVTSDTLPPQPIQLISQNDTTVVYTNAVPLPFKSVLSEDDQELRPLKPIFDFAAAWLPWIIAALLLIVAGALVYWFYFRDTTKEEPEPAPTFTPAPFVDPILELDNTLQQLKDVNLESREHLIAFYVQLGDAIRTYFEQLYDIPALESSTGELMRALNSRAIDERLVKQTRVVLREADMVKFAKFTPSREQARMAYDKAEEFLALVQDIHSARIRQMYHQHTAKVEQERKMFDERQNEDTV